MGSPREPSEERVAWGKEEQRNERAFAKGGSEGYGACSDVFHVKHLEGVPPELRVLWGAGKRMIRSLLKGGPRASPAKRVAWGKEEQRSE